MRILAHLDLDAFFAAVEELENPELRDKPLVVGGDPHSRGVVSTANYAARRFGIHSAMSAAEALRRCPTAVFLRPRHALYRQYSRVVWDTIGEIVPRIERTGIDEGYLDLATVASRLHARASRRLGDPDRRAREDEPDVLARGRRPRRSCARSRPTGASPAGSRSSHPEPRRASSRRSRCACCPGVGPRAEERLRRAGVDTIGALAALGDAELRSLLPGTVGAMLRDRARGIDPRDLDLELEPVSVSAEDTFARDLADRERLHDEVRRLAELVSERLRNSGPLRPHGHREAPLRATSPSARARRRCPRRSTRPSSSARWRAASSTVGCATGPGALRLVGVGVSGLSPYRQLTLEES